LQQRFVGMEDELMFIEQWQQESDLFPTKYTKINWPWIIHVRKCYVITYVMDSLIETLYYTFLNSVHQATNFFPPA